MIKIPRRIFGLETKEELWNRAIKESEHYHLQLANRYPNSDQLKTITKESSKRALKQGPSVHYN